MSKSTSTNTALSFATSLDSILLYVVFLKSVIAGSLLMVGCVYLQLFLFLFYPFLFYPLARVVSSVSEFGRMNLYVCQIYT